MGGSWRGAGGGSRWIGTAEGARTRRDGAGDSSPGHKRGDPGAKLLTGLTSLLLAPGESVGMGAGRREAPRPAQDSLKPALGGPRLRGGARTVNLWLGGSSSSLWPAFR